MFGLLSRVAPSKELDPGYSPYQTLYLRSIPSRREWVRGDLSQRNELLWYAVLMGSVVTTVIIRIVGFPQSTQFLTNLQ
jgi:hypothetical protein